MVDVELVLPIGSILFATAGFVYAAFSTYIYFRFERSNADMHVPVAIFIFALHYVFAFCLFRVHGDYLLSLLLLAGMPLTLALVIWTGSQSKSKAGTRIALAGLFTLAAFSCAICLYIYQSARHSWR